MLRPCTKPGCPELVKSGKCERHKAKARQQHDRHRGTAAQRGYGHRWRKLRSAFLSQHPLCCMCTQQNIIEPATVVDHKTPHNGDVNLLFDWHNLQGLCKLHHDSTKQSEERTGHAKGCEDDGTPLDPSHFWNSQG